MKRPFITANFAQTWDARISTRNHTPVDFSSPTDKRCLFEIRASADAILCGSRTIATDDATLALPQRSLRAQRIKAGKPPCPLRVLITNSGRLNPSLKIFSETSAPLLIFSTTRMPARIRRALEEKADLHLTDKPSVDLHAMLAHLHAQRGVERLLCEGGPTLLRSLLEADLVDQIHLTLCPLLFGGLEAPGITGPAASHLAQSRHWRLESMQVHGGECFLRYGRK